MKPILFVTAVLGASWSVAIAFMVYSPTAPIQFLGGDLVSPTKARAGEAVTVTRSFRILRDDPMTVTRTMISGDCAVSCEIVDLPGGNLALSAGEYLNMARDHVIPAVAQPGMWRLVFSVNWRDHLNRERRVALPALDVEVVQ